MTLKQFLRDAAERAVSTFIQTFAVVLFAAGTDVLDDPAWGPALVAGGIAAAVSVLTSLASIPLPALPPYVDLAVRVTKTFLQAFVGALVVSNYIDVNWAGALATAVPVALLALAKGLIAMGVPGTEVGPTLLKAVPPAIAADKVAANTVSAASLKPGQSLADPGQPLK